MNSKSLAINYKSYLILAAGRPVTFISVFDEPIKFADEAILKRLEHFSVSQVVNTYRNCHQEPESQRGSQNFCHAYKHHVPATVIFPRRFRSHLRYVFSTLKFSFRRNHFSLYKMPVFVNFQNLAIFRILGAFSSCFLYRKISNMYVFDSFKLSPRIDHFALL